MKLGPLIAVMLLALPACVFAEAPPTMQDTAIKLFESLTPEQKQAALLPFDSPEKKSEIFTGGKRAGIQIKSLSEEQQKLAMDLLTAFTSPAGKETALAITLQKPDNPDSTSGFGRYYLCFFGEAGAGKTYAWRITEHHLTLVHVDVEKGQPTTFGPILLGANPPELFGDEEEKMIALYGAMTADERAKCANTGKGISSVPPHGKSIKVGDLNPTAKDAAKAVVDDRLAFFSASIQQEIKRALEANGGVEALQIHFYGEATKKCRDGGRWDFKLAGKDFLCDYENTRAHIHLSLKSMSSTQK